MTALHTVHPTPPATRTNPPTRRRFPDGGLHCARSSLTHEVPEVDCQRRNVLVVLLPRPGNCPVPTEGRAFIRRTLPQRTERLAASSPPHGYSGHWLGRAIPPLTRRPPYRTTATDATRSSGLVYVRRNPSRSDCFSPPRRAANARPRASPALRPLSQRRYTTSCVSGSTSRWSSFARAGSSI